MDQTDLMRIKLSPLFDEKYYYTMRPDVKEAGIDAAYHYMYQGWKEHTNPSENFITDIYLANHPKVNKIHYCIILSLVLGRIILIKEPRS